MKSISDMQCNLGGIVPISTVDWPGYASVVLFLRGCPNHCLDCHNKGLLKEGTTIPMKEVFTEIKTASKFISALIISGGEPTKHKDELITILEYAKRLKLRTRIQTSGIYPDTIKLIIDKQLIDSIALDIKVELVDSNTFIPKDFPKSCISDTLRICEQAFAEKKLNDFEVVHTIFPHPGYKRRLKNISHTVGKNTRFVLQQGIPSIRSIKPLSRDQLYELAQYIQQPYKLLRTKEYGEEKLT